MTNETYVKATPTTTQVMSAPPPTTTPEMPIFTTNPIKISPAITNTPGFKLLMELIQRQVINIKAWNDLYSKTNCKATKKIKAGTIDHKSYIVEKLNDGISNILRIFVLQMTRESKSSTKYKALSEIFINKKAVLPDNTSMEAADLIRVIQGKKVLFAPTVNSTLRTLCCIISFPFLTPCMLEGQKLQGELATSRMTLEYECVVETRPAQAENEQRPTAV